MESKRIVLIDGDILLYETCFGSKLETPDENQGFSTKQVASTNEEDKEKTWEETKELFRSKMLLIQSETGCTKFHGFLSPSRRDNFRSAVAKSKGYKSSREDKELPAWFNELKKHMIEDYGFHKLVHIETDDAMTHIQSEYNAVNNVYCICASKDKDIRQVPGWHYNWVDGSKEFVTVEESWYNLWMQMLIGDSTDDILGCGEEKPSYWGCKKKLLESGDFPVVSKEEYVEGQNYPSKAAAERAIEKLFSDALEYPGKATRLKDRYGVEQVYRREGVGPKEAKEILSKVSIAQAPAQVLVQYMIRFGQRIGIEKYAESHQLLHLLRTKEEVDRIGEPDFYDTERDFNEIFNPKQEVDDEF